MPVCAGVVNSCDGTGRCNKSVVFFNESRFCPRTAWSRSRKVIAKKLRIVAWTSLHQNDSNLIHPQWVIMGIHNWKQRICIFATFHFWSCCIFRRTAHSLIAYKWHITAKRNNHKLSNDTTFTNDYEATKYILRTPQFWIAELFWGV